jgi:hypothetical protein
MAHMPQWMKIPNLALSYQTGSGRDFSNSSLGAYVWAGMVVSPFDGSLARSAGLVHGGGRLAGGA